MSKIALTPNASGTGTFTLAAPNSNTSRTITLPDEAGEVLVNTATGVDISGTITSDGLTVESTPASTDVAILKPLAGSSSSTTILDLQGGNGSSVFKVKNGPVDSFTLDSSGNVGIGTSSPNVQLKLEHANRPSVALKDLSTNNELYVEVENGIAEFNAYTAGTGARVPIVFTQYTDERMRITSSGNVGIGTSSPDGKLHVAGTLTIADSSDVNVLNLGSIGGTTRIQGRSGGGNQPLTFWTNDTERMRIDSSGNLLVGKTSSGSSVRGSEIRDGTSGFVATFKSDADGINIDRSTDGSLINLRKNGSTVGSIETSGNDLSIGTGDLFLKFYDAGPAFIPRKANDANSDNYADLGNSNNRFDDIYATNGTIQTSDRNEKQDIEVLSDAETRVAQACKGLLRKFRWKDAVAEKGDDARIHFGIIAQDLQDAFAAEGLDAGRYAMFISSTWTDEETGEERTRLGVRYPELLAFIIGAM